MTASGPAGSSDRAARLRVAMGRERVLADRAAERARSHERALAATPTEPLRQMHAHAALVHRQAESRHREVLAVYRSCAELRAWAGPGSVRGETGGFMAAVARIAHWPGAFATVRGAGTEDVALCSDPLARAAHDVEMTLGEGPGLDTLRRGPLLVTGDDLVRRWVGYGPEARRRGIGAVAAVSFGGAAGRLGSVVAVSTSPRVLPSGLADLHRVTGAFSDVLLSEDPASVLDGGSILGAAHFEPVIHQASGMVAVHHRCSCDDALAMLRARAFAGDTELADLCAQIVSGYAVLS